MNRYLAVGMAVLVGIGLVVTWKATFANPLAGATHPWEEAQAVLTATEADIQTGGGIMPVRAHVRDLEQVLADARADSRPWSAGKSVAAASDSYRRVSFYLGSYYDEIGKPAEAVRVLDAGLALPAVKGEIGEREPFLITERGAALNALRRFPEALANDEAGLKIEDLEDQYRARLLRGRGFALLQLGRLDDGEASYRDSLKIDPDNPVALRELQYVASLRAGGPAKGVLLVMPNAPMPTK